MKKLLIMLLCILTLTGCAASYDGPTEEKPVLTGYTVRKFYDIFGLEGQTHTSSSTYAYDIYGNRVQTKSYDEGELTTVVNMRYDDRGNLISETRWDHSGWIPHVDRRTTHTYDEQDRLLTSTERNLFGLARSTSTHTYDDEAHTSTYEGPMDRIVYHYDENGVLLRDVAETQAGTIESVYTYDARGNRTCITSTLNGKPYYRVESDYDDRDRQIRYRVTKEGSTTVDVTYTYDDEAHTTTTLEHDGDIRIEYYTEDGRISLIEDYNEEGELTMYQQYDYQNIRIPIKEE